MKRLFLLSLLSFPVFLATGQSFLDEFGDGDIADWTGNPEFFIANPEGELQLNGDCVAGGDHYIVQALPTLDAAEWSFQVQLDFDPSNANHTRIYLQSDIPELTGEPHGYFVRVGVDGSGDVVELWRASGATSNLVIAGTISVSTTPQVGIRVTRSEDALWELWVDGDGGTDYILDGSNTDDTYNGGLYAGIRCKYSSTRCDLFYFDDFYINPLYFDTDPPELDLLSVENATTLIVDFNEPVELLSSESISNYTVSGGVGNPVNATRNAADQSQVTLTFAADFPEAVTLTLAINGVADMNGNATSGLVGDFTFAELHTGDVVISEIMADPEPVIGLPAEEYIELQNTTGFVIELAGFGISDASGPSDPLPAYALEPGGYVILCDDGAAAAFAAFPNLIAVSGFPSLNNDGDDLSLIGPTGNTLHSVAYTTAWYQNELKAGGGWSLEMIDPSNTCQGIENWTASVAPSGGTPGALNSVDGDNPDTEAPLLLQVFPQTIDSILITLSEPVLTDLVTMDQIEITDETGSPLSVSAILIDNATPERIGVVVFPALETGVVYTLALSDIQDCAGNVIGAFATQQFGLPEDPAVGDIVINEILFNPVSGGFDYIELFNRSQKIVDLNTMTIAEADITDSTIIKEFGIASPSGRLLFPGRYVCITQNTDQVIAQYFTIDTGNFITNSNLPNYDDGEGIAILYDRFLNEVDHLHFFDDWHYALLEDEDGVSLERVNYAQDTQDENNWHSASSNVHFGTPGYQNSVFGDITGGGTFEVEYPVFSPDGDGYHDLLILTYTLEAAGFTGSIIIFDAQGRPVRYLVNNDLLGLEGFFTWDGVNNDDLASPSGIYIIYGEFFNLDGGVERFKRKCTLVRKY